jgi:hypothetical protein
VPDAWPEWFVYRNYEPVPEAKPPLPELKYPEWFIEKDGHTYVECYEAARLVAKLTIRLADDGQSYEIETEDLR